MNKRRLQKLGIQVLREAWVMHGDGLYPQRYMHGRRIYLQDLAGVYDRIGCGDEIDGHLHLVDMYADRVGAVDPFEHIPENRLPHFLSVLACQMAIDQTVYTYLPEIFAWFREETLYPKVTWTIGHCYNVPPWQLFDPRITTARGIDIAKLRETFSHYARFILEEQKKLLGSEWRKARTAMLNDKDINTTEFGTIFRERLRNIPS